LSECNAGGTAAAGDRLLTGNRETVRLRERADFERVFTSGRFLGHSLLMLHFLRNDGVGRRVGFVAGKKVGGAVRRNRARRVLREAFRALEGSLLSGVDVVLVGRRDTPEGGTRKVALALEELARRAGLWRREEDNGESRH
jgi:ribonuclease P protein component